MIHLVKVVIAAVVALLFSSCNMNFNGESITGSGNVVTKNRDLSGFTRIEVSKGLECEVTQSPDFKVTVEADDNLQKGIITKVENGTLKITSEYGSYFNVKSKKIYVSLPVIDELQTTSGSNLYTKGVIKSNGILLKSSSGSDLNATVESERVALESSSGSSLKVKGKAIDVSTASSSGSDIDARELLANNVNSQSSSGSDTDIHPIVSLQAKASSGSSIDYFSSPKRKSIEESSGGSVDAN
ncbi:head GIN domain-containing protein [Flavobacterium sp. H122]|uniref:head GIN domain-containing protein n=1 Tax=Flavobacterium sp. H122 TaxID=2529860 RepID=UPI00145BC945|nr:head GIN domain-containing protein [Flavobacterium sp. H122]